MTDTWVTAEDARLARDAATVPTWQQLEVRHNAAVARFEALAKKTEAPAKHVGAAIRDGLVFEAASHACAALVGCGAVATSWARRARRRWLGARMTPLVGLTDLATWTTARVALHFGSTFALAIALVWWIV
jgi:hypothetical protein